LELPNQEQQNIKIEIKLSKVDEDFTAIEFMMVSGDRTVFNGAYATAENVLKEII